MKAKSKTAQTVLKSIIIVVACLLAVLIILDTVSINWHSNPENVITYNVSNPAITTDSTTQISAHRSGGGIMPEESLMAFKNCVESTDFKIDVFEFDLHITKDDKLVLLHDDTLDRTTDSETVLGVKDAKPENYTYEELRQLNIGAKFEDDDGNYPYSDISSIEDSNDLRILKVDDILDFLESYGEYNYIIEIKNDGDLGKKGVDILYDILKERDLLDRVIFGTFHEEVSFYVDDNHPDLKRSATINEVLEFYKAALTDDENFQPKYAALQVPYNMPWRIAANLGTAKMVNYAHKHNLAVQYWTINDESQMKYLHSIGADCIMTDYPDQLYKVLYEE